MSRTLTILAVHGNGGGSSRFMRLPDHLPDGVRLVAIDLPGFEGTPMPAEVNHLSVYGDHLAAEIAALRGENETGPIVVLGTGIGGSIALDLASRRPDSMDGLILHAIVGASLDTRLFPRVMSTNVVRELIRRAITFGPLRPLLTRIFFPTGAPKPVLDAFFDGYRTCAAFGTMFDLINVEWFEGLDPIGDLPTTLLWGEHDRVLKSHQADLIKAKAPAAEIVIQPGWDHFPMIEQPEEYARVIADLAGALVASAAA